MISRWFLMPHSLCFTQEKRVPKISELRLSGLCVATRSRARAATGHACPCLTCCTACIQEVGQQGHHDSWNREYYRFSISCPVVCSATLHRCFDFGTDMPFLGRRGPGRDIDIQTHWWSTVPPTVTVSAVHVRRLGPGVRRLPPTMQCT